MYITHFKYPGRHNRRHMQQLISTQAFHTCMACLSAWANTSSPGYLCDLSHVGAAAYGIDEVFTSWGWKSSGALIFF